MENSKIGWCHHTMNPVIGCSKVSAGCAHCYAETLENRWGRGWGPSTPRRRTSVDYWKQPYKWDKAAGAAGERHRVFCASMADVGEDVPEWIETRRDLSVMIERTPNLDWLLLTKRPENMVRLFARWNSTVPGGGWPSNVWVGTSVENQAAADERIPHLFSIPTKTRFLSCEPLIGPIDLQRHLFIGEEGGPEYVGSHKCLLDWAIIGGESGKGARPMDPSWARTIAEDCKRAKVSVFMKQMGGVHDKREDLEQLPPDLRVREFPKTSLTQK